MTLEDAEQEDCTRPGSYQSVPEMRKNRKFFLTSDTSSGSQQKKAAATVVTHTAPTDSAASFFSAAAASVISAVTRPAASDGHVDRIRSSHGIFQNFF